MTAVQHAVLTDYEAFCIQFFIFAQACGKTYPIFTQPSDHAFESLEVRVPLTGSFRHENSGLVTDPNCLVSVASPDPYLDCPLQLKCSLCPFSDQWYERPSAI